MIKVETTPFGTADDQAITLFTLTNAAGMQVGIINYGGIVQSLRVPDAKGAIDDVVLGFDTLAEYTGGNIAYFGALCGRVANRITAGRFTLAGRDYTLATNNAPNSLHGGLKGYDKRVWEATATADGVRLTLDSADGEEGYPGTLSISMTYALTEANELVLDYSATTDATTIVNLTNHSYFNLAGHAAGAIHDHTICINASRYTPVDETLMPTGEIASLVDTPLDFLAPHKIGERIEAAGGYDHNYIIDEGATVAVRVSEPVSGRIMEMETSEPALQFYSGNFLVDLAGKGGACYPQHGGFCLESQHYPDSVNQPSFPSTQLEPGETYRHHTLYRFSTAG
jgi:aldose 1-epimerase